MNDEAVIEFEVEARKRSVALEAAGKLPDGFTERYHPLTPPERRALRRLSMALLLAKDVDTFCALARGRRVPRHRLREDELQKIERAA